MLAVDPVQKTVRITGSDVEGLVNYDRLLIAVGRRLATERIPGYFEHSHHLLNIAAAERFKEAIEGFDGGTIVLGLGPGAFLPVPVCESSLALAKRFADKVANGSVQIKAVFPETLDDAFVGSSLFRDLRGAFSANGVELVERFPIDRIEKDTIVSEEGDKIAYDLLMVVPPFRGQSPVQNLDAVSGNAGFIHVNKKLQVTGNEGIYAAGDIISLPGPRFGYMAIRQGKIAAVNIRAEIEGRDPDADYEHKIAWALSEKYTDPVFFHYGFWDESLEDFDENSFFGMAKAVREKYGHLREAGQAG